MFSKTVLLSLIFRACYDIASQDTMVFAQKTLSQNARRIHGHSLRVGAGHYGNRRHGMAAVDDGPTLGARPVRLYMAVYAIPKVPTTMASVGPPTLANHTTNHGYTKLGRCLRRVVVLGYRFALRYYWRLVRIHNRPTYIRYSEGIHCNNVHVF